MKARTKDTKSDKRYEKSNLGPHIVVCVIDDFAKLIAEDQCLALMRLFKFLGSHKLARSYKVAGIADGAWVGFLGVGKVVTDSAISEWEKSLIETLSSGDPAISVRCVNRGFALAQAQGRSDLFGLDVTKFPARARHKQMRRANYLRIWQQYAIEQGAENILRARDLADVVVSEDVSEEQISILTAVDRFIRTLPDTYRPRRKSLENFSDSVRQKLATALEPSLNVYAVTLPQTTYEEKKALAKWVNAELRRFGLALRCPGTNQPCLLQAYQGNHPEIGRFRFDFVDAEGHRRQPISSANLPRLELMLDDLTRAPYGQRAQRLR
jgi:hypothetical protein